MPRKQIKRKCGHIENIYLEDREFNDPAALKHHEDELCEKCYVSTNRCLLYTSPSPRDCS